MQNAKHYRALARKQLGGSIFAKNWLLALVCGLIFSAISAVLAETLVGTLLFHSFFLFGVYTCFLAVARGQKETYAIADVFAGKSNIGSLIKLSVVKNIYLLLWAFVPIVGIVKSYSYAMVEYIKIDHPEYTTKEAITESRRMMDGYKWKFFCLELSFIGWIFVGTCCLGVGTYWVNAYMFAAKANFYNDLKKVYEAA